jgi:general stress protein 26
MAETSDIDRVWTLMEKTPICLLITRDGETLRARPMGAFVRRDENAIYLLTNRGSEKEDEVAKSANVCLAFSAGGQDYVSVSGRGILSNDREKIRELWSPIVKAWWDGPDDPHIRLLRVTPDDAELWDSPGKIASVISMLAASVTGARPAVGENRKVTL